MLKLVDESVAVVKMVSDVERLVVKRDRVLADQMHRAVLSVALNVAEGQASRGRKEAAMFQVALASARECAACVRIAGALGYVGDDVTAGVLDRLDYVAGALWKLVHRAA